jgi:sugar phosphate isomerase/epimerase
LKSAVTVSLVEQARGGPFVFWDDLPGSIRKAAKLGFDAVEIFAPSGQAIGKANLAPLLAELSISVAAVGTGAGWVIHKLTLTSPEASIRQAAADFIRQIIDAGAELNAPAIIGSMQGRHTDQVDEQTALEYLSEALIDLGEHAAQRGVELIYEPLNRYETNLINTLDEGVALLQGVDSPNVKLLADLFHLNIEEQDIAQAIRDAGAHVGHVHLADSNRRPAGCGHTDFAPIIEALREIGYTGYLSAECLPWPESDEAAALTIQAYHRLVG